MDKKRFVKIFAAVLAAAFIIPLLLTIFSGSAMAAPRLLKQGSRGDDVKVLQGQLKQLNYMTVEPTGVFGSITNAAVRQLQRDKGLAVDGIVGAKTQAAVDAALGGGASEPNTPADPDPVVTPDPGGNAAALTYARLLKRGTSGADVKAMQQVLNTLGFAVGTADGVFGAKTTEGVKAFQKAKGITVDGIVGKATVAAINAASGAGTANPGTTDPGTVEPAPNPATPVTQSELTGPDGYKYSRQQISSALKRGASGLDVKDLQQALKTLGYYTGVVDGQFGNGTYNAVEAFQRAMRLDADGIAGNYTLSAAYTSVHTATFKALTQINHAVDTNLPLVKPDWSENATLFPKGSTAVVVDILTGKTFQVKRTGGGNHADCEPVSFTDTATMFGVYGNWSWNRRAIWVVVNGRRLAASMNGMPHGYNSINDNGMRGQICIHFVDSKTHGSNKVDADHQNCIEKAYSATGVPGILG